MLVDPSAPATLYAASPGGGVFKSTDSGKHWAAANKSLNDPVVFSLIMDPANPQTLYAGCASGLFTTIDGAATWTRTSGALDIAQLAIDPANTKTLYAISKQGPVYVSRNAGRSWTLLANQFGSVTTYSIVVDPTDPAKLYVGAYGGLYRSTDSGKKWTLITNGLGSGTPIVSSLWINPKNPIVMYAETGLGLEKSTDSGTKWSVVSTVPEPGNFVLMTLDPAAPTTLYGLDYPSVLYTSTNSGSTWTKIGALSATYQGYTRGITVDPTNSANLYAATDEGVFVSTNKGSAWTQDNVGLANTLVTALAVDPKSPGTAYAGTESSGVFKTTNAGASWSLLYPNYTGHAYGLATDPKTPTTLYMASIASMGGSGIFKSTDGGTTWTNVLIGDFVTISQSTKAPVAIYAGEGAGVEKSTDGGATWTAVNTGLLGVSEGAALAADGNYVLLADPDLGAYLTKNAGTSWTADNPSGASEFHSAALFAYTAGKVSAHVGITYGSGALGYFLASATAPAAWTAWAAPTGTKGAICTPITALAVNTKTPTTFYAGGACGVLRGTGNGTALAAWSTGLPTRVPVYALVTAATGKKVFAGTYGGGVYTRNGP